MADSRKGTVVIRATRLDQSSDDRLFSVVKDACDAAGWDAIPDSPGRSSIAPVDPVRFIEFEGPWSAGGSLRYDVRFYRSRADYGLLTIHVAFGDFGGRVVPPQRGFGEVPTIGPAAWGTLKGIISEWIDTVPTETASDAQFTAAGAGPTSPVARLKADIEAAAGALFRLVEYIDGVEQADADLNRVLRLVEAERAQLDDIAKALRRELDKLGGPNRHSAGLLARSAKVALGALLAVSGLAQGADATGSLGDRLADRLGGAAIIDDAQGRCQQVIETVNIIEAGAGSVINVGTEHVRVTPETVMATAVVHEPTVHIDTAGPDEAPGPFQPMP